MRIPDLKPIFPLGCGYYMRNVLSIDTALELRDHWQAILGNSYDVDTRLQISKRVTLAVKSLNDV